MNVLNVLSTNAITGSTTEYQAVQSGVYRIIATAATTVSFNDGPAIQVLANQPIIIKGAKPGRAVIRSATDSATAVYTLGENIAGDTHPFSTGDYIGVVVADSSPALGSEFLSATTAGKKVTTANGITITTNIDSSAASGDYTRSGTGWAQVVRCVKVTAGTGAIVLEEVQVVGG
jgi:hypothetical protein